MDACRKLESTGEAFELHGAKVKCIYNSINAQIKYKPFHGDADENFIFVADFQERNRTVCDFV